MSEGPWEGVFIDNEGLKFMDMRGCQGKRVEVGAALILIEKSSHGEDFER